MNVKQFFQTNKVFITGLIQFVATTLYELLSKDTGNFTWWIIGYSAVIAGLTFAANNLRGQWASFSTTLLNSGASLGLLHDTNTLTSQNVFMLVFGLGINLMGLFWSTPTKNISYENTPTIQQAKVEAGITTPEKAAEQTQVQTKQ